MCKGSSTVRWLPHFLVSTAAGPACALSWWRWILALDAFGQSLTDWIWLVQAQWQINCTWSVAETIIRPGESGLDSTRLDSARQILSVWRMMMITIKFDMIILIMTWFDMINLYNWKFPGLFFTSRKHTWPTGTVGCGRDVRRMERKAAGLVGRLTSIDIHQLGPTPLEPLCSDVQRWTFVEPRWITCPGMLARRAGLVETKWDEHRTNIYANHEIWLYKLQ